MFIKLRPGEDGEDGRGPNGRSRINVIKSFSFVVDVSTEKARVFVSAMIFVSMAPHLVRHPPYSQILGYCGKTG